MDETGLYTKGVCMTRLRRFGVVAACAAVGLLSLALLPAHSAGKSEEVMNVCDQNRPGFSYDVDVGDDGFSAGDYSVFADKLLYSKSGKKAGHLNGKLTFIRPVGNRDAVILGNVLIFLPTGKLSIDFGGRFSSFNEGAYFPVTGGAGHFAHATGSVRLKSGPCQGKPGIRLRIVTEH